MEILNVPIEDVVIGEERIRRVFDPGRLNELAESIARLGLFHPIVVRYAAVGPTERPHLVAGERRLRCIRLLHEKGISFHCNGSPVPSGTVPSTQLRNLSPSEQLEAELQENTVRQDITWQERSVAIAKLHNLRANQRALVGETQSIKATTEEVIGDDPSGYQQQQVRNAIILSAHLDNPEVAKARTEKEAIKIVARDLRELFAGELAQRFNLSEVPSQHTLIHGECISLDETSPTLEEKRELSELRKIPDKVFDCIITDPPYGVGADDWVALSGSEAVTKHQYRDDFTYVRRLMEEFFPQAFRVSKVAAHLYVCCDIRLWHIWAELAGESGWEVWPVPIIWNKKGQGMIIGNVDGPRRTYEAVLYARCGKKGVQKVGADVIDVAPVQAELHAAQKPVELFTTLLEWSCVAGDRILDPFCGSGTVFPAANRLRLIATAIEKRPENIVVAQRRINEIEEKDQALLSF